jgi:predicted dehydrogenase
MTKLRIGVIGLGRGTDLAQYWNDPEGRSVVVAGADINEKGLSEFKSRVGPDVYLTHDYKELLKRSDIDAIAVTSPDYCHEEHCVDALLSGKPVFCEKPMAITVEGCDRIIETSKKTGVKLMMGFNMHYIKMFQVMKGIVDSGAIGEIRAVWVRHFVGYGGDFFFHDWHANRRNTNSLLLQKGSHDIDMIHWITGKYVKTVSAFGSLDYFGGNMDNDLTCPKCNKKNTCTEALFNRRIQCAYRQEVDVEDNIVMIMELEGGIKASYMQCHFTPDYHRNYTFIGTEGRIENSEPDNKIWLKSRRSNSWKEYTDIVYDMKQVSIGHNSADNSICKDFVEMILDGKDPLTSPYSGRMSVAVGCAATQSMRNGGERKEVL